MTRTSVCGMSMALFVSALVCILVWGPGFAVAATQRSKQVAIVLGEGTGDAGTLQTSGSVAGDEQDSFEDFSFVDLTQEEISTLTLSHYDTVILNEVFTNSLSESQKQTLSGFVTNGGKLIIHDADGTEGNNYSWLPVPAESGVSCKNCGNTDGEAKVEENNTIVSDEPSSPYYIDVNEFPGNSDAVGDANVLFSNDERWDVDIRATNDQNVEGAVDAYAEDGGLILYDGFDTDDIESTFDSGVAWLQKIWYDELNEQWNPSNLPHSTPLVGASGHCGYESITVGVVKVCAEHVSGSPSETTATGNVVLDGAVAVGNGPVAINQETKQISLTNPAPISVLRSQGPVSVGSASFTIEAAGTTEPISGKAKVAKVSLTGANLGALGSLRVGNLPFSLPGGANVTLYLDGEMGGGLIGAGSVDLSMLGKPETSGSLSLGFYAKSPHTVIALGGAVHFGAIEPRQELGVRRSGTQLPAAQRYVDGIGRSPSPHRLSACLRKHRKRSARIAAGEHRGPERAARGLGLLLQWIRGRLQRSGSWAAEDRCQHRRVLGSTARACRALLPRQRDGDSELGGLD